MFENISSLKKPFVVNPDDSDPDQQLVLAIARGNLNAAEEAIFNGANVNLSRNWTSVDSDNTDTHTFREQHLPLKMAIRENNIAMIDLLVSKGADFNNPDIAVASVASNRMDAVKFLIDRGMNLNFGYNGNAGNAIIWKITERALSSAHSYPFQAKKKKAKKHHDEAFEEIEIKNKSDLLMENLQKITHASSELMVAQRQKTDIQPEEIKQKIGLPEQLIDLVRFYSREPPNQSTVPDSKKILVDGKISNAIDLLAVAEQHFALNGMDGNREVILDGIQKIDRLLGLAPNERREQSEELINHILSGLSGITHAEEDKYYAGQESFYLDLQAIVTEVEGVSDLIRPKSLNIETPNDEYSGSGPSM